MEGTTRDTLRKVTILRVTVRILQLLQDPTSFVVSHLVLIKCRHREGCRTVFNDFLRSPQIGLFKNH